ncbi:MAG: peptidoglycan bridge formation glycyltransferase FemA/FemB family protein [Patescibacteria group bacterium]
MELKKISTDDLAAFIASLPPTSGLFLQTPAWQNFEQSQGHHAESLGFYDQGKLVASAVVVCRRLPVNFSYFYLPKGPQVAEVKYLAPVLEMLKLRYQNKGLFLRLEPNILLGESSSAVDGLIKTKSVQPAATLLLDLTQSLDEILAGMHQKTRYNIHLAEKKGLTWRLQSKDGLVGFWRLLQETAGRDQFKTHIKRHYEQLVNMFVPENLETSELAIRFAEVYQGSELLASSLLIFSGKVVTYLHGASSNKDRELMPTYLLHWQTIQEVKKLGFELYDWWGISTPQHHQATWKGVTRFKLGWGGRQVNFLGTFDFPYQKTWYWLYKYSRYLLR